MQIKGVYIEKVQLKLPVKSERLNLYPEYGKDVCWKA